MLARGTTLSKMFLCTSEKVYFKKKEFAKKFIGKLFLFRVDTISEAGLWCGENQTVNNRGKKNYQVWYIQSP